MRDLLKALNKLGPKRRRHLRTAVEFTDNAIYLCSRIVTLETHLAASSPDATNRRVNVT